jgi:hypothetical protein
MDPLVRSIHLTNSFYKARGKRSLVWRDDGCSRARTTTYDFGEGSPLAIPDPNFMQPPVWLEKLNGMSGISHAYRYPPGLKPDELQTYAKIAWRQDGRPRKSGKSMAEKLGRVFDALAALNPELEAIRPDSTYPGNIFDAVMGVASGFKPEDIAFFREIGGGSIAEKDEHYAALRGSLDRELKDGSLQWVPAPSTLNLIKAEWDRKKDAPEKAAAPAPRKQRANSL